MATIMTSFVKPGTTHDNFMASSFANRGLDMATVMTSFFAKPKVTHASSFLSRRTGIEQSRNPPLQNRIHTQNRPDISLYKAGVRHRTVMKSSFTK
jgi:hypothetical protein